MSTYVSAFCFAALDSMSALCFAAFDTMSTLCLTALLCEYCNAMFGCGSAARLVRTPYAALWCAAATQCPLRSRLYCAFAVPWGSVCIVSSSFWEGQERAPVALCATECDVLACAGVKNKRHSNQICCHERRQRVVVSYGTNNHNVMRKEGCAT